jgi:hypothetical protein
MMRTAGDVSPEVNTSDNQNQALFVIESPNFARLTVVNDETTGGSAGFEKNKRWVTMILNKFDASLN